MIHRSHLLGLFLPSAAPAPRDGPALRAAGTLLRRTLASSALCGALGSALLAQEVPVVEPLPQEVGPASMLGGDNALLDMNAAESAAIDAAEFPEPVLDAPNPGPPSPKWRVIPHFDVGIRWDDNIFIQPTGEISDLIFTFAPGLVIGYVDEESRLERFLDREERASRALKYEGNFFLLDYTPAFVFFAENDGENSVDHDARFEARWQLQKLSLAAEARFLRAKETNTELNTRLEHTGISAGLAVRYQFSERTSAEVGAYYQKDEYEEASGNTEYRAEAYLNYALSPVIELSVGTAFGLVEVERAENQTFERLLARGTYLLTEKVEARAQAGVEFRHSDGSGGDQTNPIFELELTYRPAELTRIGLAVSRRVQASISQPEDSVESTGIALTFARTLRDGLRFVAEVGYRTLEFSDSQSGAPRADDYFYGRAALIYNFATWGSAGLSYEYRNNDSSRSASGFTNNQIALDLSLTF